MAYGSLPLVTIGATFPNRAALQASGSHRDRESGIIGHADQLGAESIVINRPGRGYGDDLDLGLLVIYTGHGGRDRRTGRQIADQRFTHRNKTLAMNVETEQAVRVHRQVDGGFRYDGLYQVEQAWRSPGRDGFAVCRFRMRKAPTAAVQTDGAMRQGGPPRSTTSSVTRLVRDGDVPQQVKTWHDYTCQMCGSRLLTAVGAYAEGAHILPLGGGYNGPDITSNLLCLCPNCHIQLDHGGLFITDDLDVVTAAGTSVGRLRTHEAHLMDVSFLRAHRGLFCFDTRPDPDATQPYQQPSELSATRP